MPAAIADRPPRATPKRAPYSWHTYPRIGPPIGVLPRNTMAWSANTRPRIEGSERSWTIAVEVVMNAMLEMPTRIPIGYANGMLGVMARSSIDAPNPYAAQMMLRTVTVERRADHRAPASEPML